MTDPDMVAQSPRLAGMRILVVEDRGLIAAKIVQILRAADCVPVGPASTLARGTALLQESGERLSGAVLDIDLRGKAVYPLAEALRERGIPLLFVTGYCFNAIPPEWRTTHRVEKPFDAASLIAGLEAACGDLPAQPVSSLPSVGSMQITRAWDTVRLARNIVTETRITIEESEQTRMGRRE
ncbi:response regulator [Azospirillum endophyticum]